VHIGITAFLSDQTIGASEWAREVEARGFYSLYLPEHTHMPVGEDSPPSVVEGVNPDNYRRSIDPYVALAAAGAVTSRLKLGTGVSLVAQHDPIVLAKQIATIDHMSGGRFVLGIGFGWNKVEAADHGIDFGARREIAREKVLCMKEIWSKDQAEFHGEFVQLPPSWSWPKPVQKPAVRILVGGAAGTKTYSAIAEYADGWMPIGGAGISAELPRLRRMFEEQGRDPAELYVVPFGSLPTPGKLEHLATAGCTEVVLRVPTIDTSEMLRCLDTFSVFLDQGWSTGG
jgi:probable F420-dependent oxidoreductase